MFDMFDKNYKPKRVVSTLLSASWKGACAITWGPDTIVSAQHSSVKLSLSCSLPMQLLKVKMGHGDEAKPFLSFLGAGIERRTTHPLWMHHPVGIASTPLQ